MESWWHQAKKFSGPGSRLPPAIARCPISPRRPVALATPFAQSFPTSSATMFLRRSLLAILLITVAAFFSAQSVEAAAKGPKITNKVYFDIKHGDKDLGRSACPCVLKFTPS